MSFSNQRCAQPTKIELAADVDRLLRQHNRPAEPWSLTESELLDPRLRNSIEELTGALLESFPEIDEDRARAFAQKQLIPRGA